jgi:hypothetical protein
MQRTTGFDVLNCELEHPDPLVPKNASPVAVQLLKIYPLSAVPVREYVQIAESHISNEFPV